MHVYAPLMKLCDRCKEAEATHTNILLQQTDEYYISDVTKDICDKCFNEIKAADGAGRYMKAQKILDGEE